MTSRKCHNLAAWDAAVLDARRLVARAQKCQAYQDCDPFDNYNNASLRWTVHGTAPTFSSSYARFAPPAGLPGQGIYLPSGSYLSRSLSSNQQTLIGKIAYCPLAYTGGSDAATAIMAYDNGLANSEIALTVTTSGALQLWAFWASPYSVVRYTSAPGIITPGTYYGIEWLLTISPTAGVLQVWVNGLQVINASSLNTDTGTSYANRVFLGDSVNPGCYLDDYRLWDNTGSYQNAPLGTDSLMITKLPSGAGALTLWTPNGAAANWQCVDDNPPDGDSTYVSNATASVSEAYTMPHAGFTAPPAMVLARSYARKDDGATRSMAVGTIVGGAGSTAGTVVLGSTYQWVDGVIDLDPSTGLAWTAAGADSAQHLKIEVA